MGKDKLRTGRSAFSLSVAVKGTPLHCIVYSGLEEQFI